MRSARSSVASPPRRAPPGDGRDRRLEYENRWKVAACGLHFYLSPYDLLWISKGGVSSILSPGLMVT